jgi:glycyl-tRNA synthetase beta chain
MESQDFLLEIGVEELPASFVEGALRALPALAGRHLGELRLPHGEVKALGTPRRLALLITGLATQQPDLEQEVLGPPASVGFDKSGAPTRAAEAFAQKLGLGAGDLRRVATPKGDYLAGTKRERGRPTAELLAGLLPGLCGEIPFRKSMRWSTHETAFGRPVRWLVALYGDSIVPFAFAGCQSDRVSRGHRFLAPGEVRFASPAGYVEQLAAAHVEVDPAGRRERMVARLHEAAREAGGTLIEDEFLVGENLSLVEEPHVITGRFEERFLSLPEEVILEVARGHQRYFGLRGPDGALLPRYLAVANTALDPEGIARGNDRVMRARLSDARFFVEEDRKHRLESRAAKLDGIVFHHRLGSVGDKVRRLVAIVGAAGPLVGVAGDDRAQATRAAELCKCDLVSLMVGEFPELQGVMGRAYALGQGESVAVADAVRDHYAPKGAHDAVATGPIATLVGLADRLDTLVGGFAVGLVPTGAADPYALRRACLGVLRQLLGQGWDTPLAGLFALAYQGLAGQGKKLDLTADEVSSKLGDFFTERLRHLLAEQWPADVVDACLAVASDRPVDAAARIRALSRLDAGVRAKVGEVFKRAANIAKESPDSALPVDPATLETAPHASEVELFSAYRVLEKELGAASEAHDYAAAFAHVAAFAPRLHEFFTHVFVMTEDLPLRNNRLRLMRAVRDACSRVAHVQLLQPPPAG